MASADACMLCAKPFGVVAHKQNCRMCGKVFCGRCIKANVEVPQMLLKKVSVCSNCVKTLAQAP